MSSITAIFGNSTGKEQDSEKLMDLYWNRAELKKEFANLRKEQFRLNDRIKREESRTARLQQKLQHLESLLSDPQCVHNVVVHYQLRHLSNRCSERIAKFSEELKQQRERKQHDSLVGGWRANLDAEISSVQERILTQQEQIHRLEQELDAERQRLTSMSTFLRIFRGRRITGTLDRLARQLEESQHDEQSLGTELDGLRSKTPPDTRGLDISTKRSINLMILSFAQHIYLHFDQFGLSEQIREAGEKSVGAVSYGSQDECANLLRSIRKAMDKMEQDVEFAGVLQKRAKLLGAHAQYQAATDAVPLAGTIAYLIGIDSNELVRESSLDILGRNYWGVSKLLSR